MKIGKTTFAASLKNNLFLSTEIGTNAIAGLYAQPIVKWGDFKKVLRQLSDPRAKDLYKTVTIDTVTILYDLCVKYICQQNNVDSIGDIPYGKGYSLVSNEFAESLRQISMLGFGLIFIAHADVRVDQRSEEEGGAKEIIGPKLDKRCYAIINAMVDIIGYIGSVFDEQTGESRRFLWTRETPTIAAGTRFRYLPAKIPFGYNELVKAIDEAIEKQRTIDGDVIVEKDSMPIIQERSFDEAMNEAKQLWKELLQINPQNGERMTYIVEKTFGQGVKISQATERQKDLVEIVIDELKRLRDDQEIPQG